MLSELRFKQKQDKWSTVLKTKSTVDVDSTLKVNTSRDADFEKTLKGVQRAEQVKRAPLKKDYEKLLKVVGSFVNDLKERVKQTNNIKEGHEHFLKKMAETDEEELSVLTGQKKLMEVLSDDSKALAQYLQAIKKTKKKENDDFDMDESATPTSDE